MQTILSVSLALPGDGCALASVQIAGNLARNQMARLGEVIEGDILVTNSGTEVAELCVRQADFDSFAESTPQRGSGRRVVHVGAGLVSVEPHEFRMEAAETVRLRFSCRVPASAWLTGSYRSLVTIEPRERRNPARGFHWETEIDSSHRSVGAAADLRVAS